MNVRFHSDVHFWHPIQRKKKGFRYDDTPGNMIGVFLTLTKLSGIELIPRLKTNNVVPLNESRKIDCCLVNC